MNLCDFQFVSHWRTCNHCMYTISVIQVLLNHEQEKLEWFLLCIVLICWSDFMYVKHAAISDQLVLLYSPNNNEKCLLSISQIFNIKQIIQAECQTSSWWGSISILWLKSCNAQTGLGWSYKHGLCQVSTGRELLTDSTVHIILCFVLCRNKMFTNFCLYLLIFQWFRSRKWYQI